MFVYVCCCFVVDYSLCSCLFVGVSWLVIRCVRVCLCRLVVVNVYAGTINRRIRLVFVAYMVGICSVYSWYRSAILHRIFCEMCCVHSTNGWCTFR